MRVFLRFRFLSMRDSSFNFIYGVVVSGVGVWIWVFDVLYMILLIFFFQLRSGNISIFRLEYPMK